MKQPKLLVSPQARAEAQYLAGLLKDVLTEVLAEDRVQRSQGTTIHNHIKE